MYLNCCNTIAAFTLPYIFKLQNLVYQTYILKVLENQNKSLFWTVKQHHMFSIVIDFLWFKLQGAYFQLTPNN